MQVFIPRGYALTISSDEFTTGTYRRLGNPGASNDSPVEIAASTDVTIGAFNEPYTYELCSLKGELTYTQSFSGVFTAADDVDVSLLAPKASPTFSGTMTMSSGAKQVLAKSTGTEAANVVTINAQCGVITTSSLTTAASGSYVVTLTNNKIVGSGSIILASIAGGTNTVKDISVEASCTAANTAVLTIYNNVLITTALDGTVIINFMIV